MRIDAHQHYWAIARGDYGWITPHISTLYRDFYPSDLQPSLQKHALDGTIVVQAAPTLAESKFILELADQSPSILGVVGWIDVFAEDHKEQLAQLRQYTKFVGLRIMLQDMEDCNQLLEPQVLERISYYVEEDIPLDLLVVAKQLDTVLALLEVFPTMRAVIDHIGKPNIAEAAFQPWAEQISQIAQYPNVYCKLSGMATEADHSNWSYQQFVPYIEKVLSSFGMERVMFGSDWPVCLLAASYDEVMEIVETALPSSWGAEERARLFGGNAAAFYKLPSISKESRHEL